MPHATPPRDQTVALSRDLTEFLIELAIALHQHAIYPAGHPLAAGAARRVNSRAAALLANRPTLTFGVARRQLVIDGVLTDREHPLLHDLALRFNRVDVGAVRIERGARVADVAAFLDWVATRNAALSSAPTAAASRSTPPTPSPPTPCSTAYGVAGLLHDLGKVCVPVEILNKPGPLTDAERPDIQPHPAEGARIILRGDAELDLTAVVAYEHHIMLNGGGYPRPHFGRVYDALRTRRPYRDAWPADDVLAYLERGAGTEFDPDLVHAFVAMMRSRELRAAVV